MDDKAKTKEYKQVHGLDSMARADWDEVNKIIAATNIYTTKTYGPDRVVGFSPIPAISTIPYAVDSCYLLLIGGTCLNFYDWYCDLPVFISSNLG